MTTQLNVLAAAVLDNSVIEELAAYVSEPSAATMVLVSIAGVIVGRFLLPGKAPSAD